MVTSFRYLGRLISAAEDHWTELVRKLSQTRSVWKRMTIILIREGADPQVYTFYFKAVVKLVLLFSLEIWVVTSHIGRALGGGSRTRW